LGFKVIDVGTTGKLVGSACYGTQQKSVSGEDPESLSHLGLVRQRVVTDRRTDGQIDTNLLRTIASTADELSSGTNIDDLERP